MRLFSGKILFPLLVVLVIGTMVGTHYSRVIKCPNCVLFVDNADGLKNYFTPAWYVKYDRGLWFEGMNFPYGEHPVYTDNQPAVSILLKGINAIIPIADQTIGVLHILLLLSLVFTGLCCYFLLRRFDLPRWYSALVSVPVTLLSPQLERFHGHYSLAYTVVLPLFLLLLVNWLENRGYTRKWYLLGLGLTCWITFAGFTHLYFFFIAGVFLLCLAFVQFVIGGFRLGSQVVGPVAVTIASLLLVYGGLKLTDPVDDRPTEAWGVDKFNATTKGTFYPWFEPVRSYWVDKRGITMPDVESRSYLGGPVVLMSPFIGLWILLTLYRRNRLTLGRRNRARWFERNATHPLFLILASVLVWLFASAWFHQLGDGFLIDSLPMISHFRSLGRMVWVVYYAGAIAAAWFFYMKWRYLMRVLRPAGYLLSVLGIAMAILWYWEGYQFFRQQVPRSMVENNTFNGSTPFADALENNGYSPDDFQGVFVVPITAIGSEKLALQRGFWWLRQGWQCAWESGLPLVVSAMSRTSLSQTADLVQLTSDSHIHKSRLDRMSGKPLLLLAPKRDNLVDAEYRIVQMADSIAFVNNIQMLALDIEDLAKNVPDTTRHTAVFSIDFDENSSEQALSGQGALHTTEEYELITEVADTFESVSSLHFSCWVYVGKDIPVFPNISHKVITADRKDAISVDHYNMFTYTPYNVIDQWMEVEFAFPVDSTGYVHTFTVSPPGSWVDSVRITK